MDYKVEFIDVNDLKPYENNAKKHPQDQIERIALSIKEFGFRQNLVVDKNNCVIIGHGRLLAAQLLGIDKVPCIRADNLTEEQVRALRLADNKVAESQWDFDALDEELDSILDINMADFGFLDGNIDWNDVEDLTEETYEEPEHNMLECPSCHHKDRAIHFKKVSE